MTKEEKEFIATVKEFYRRHKRRNLPWRKTKNPYHILVSEIMLQQTQVDRVVPKYIAFLRVFPTCEVLARAPLSSVLRVWQGLGYNRRAKMLHECARVISKKHHGAVPRVYEELIALPGIGTYTAGAVMAFAYNQPLAVIETNIRSVYLHHFFSDDVDVTDALLMPYIEHTLDHKNPRSWYYALMDYGAFIKKMYGNPNKRSRHHTKQSVFKGSDRQIRGEIIRALARESLTRTKLFLALSQFSKARISTQLKKLKNERLVAYAGRTFSLPT